MDVLNPNAAITHFRKHVTEMSEQGWTLVTVSDIPRTKYNEYVAFSEVVGYLLFWQKYDESNQQGLLDKLVKEVSEQVVAAMPAQAPAALAATNDGADNATPVSPPPPPSEVPMPFEPAATQQFNEPSHEPPPPPANGIDLNKKYQVNKKARSSTMNTQAFSPPTTAMVSSQTSPPVQNPDTAPAQLQQSPHNMKFPEADQASTPMGPPQADGDFNPADPLVHEVRSLRNAVVQRGYIVDPSARENVPLDAPED